jgi:hypothetical protein
MVEDAELSLVVDQTKLRMMLVAEPGITAAMQEGAQTVGEAQ